MLHHLINGTKDRALRSVSRFYGRQYLPETVVVPSARFGIYAVAKELFSAGGQVLISPLTCHTVIDSLLYAGVTPVFVDIEMETGNIDVTKLSDRMLAEAKGIITTNLYGNPDPSDQLSLMARRHGLYLIEDCAHVLHTTVSGRPIGTFGDASIFSFKKYFGQPGGIVTLRDRDLAGRIALRTGREAAAPSPKEERLRIAQYYVERGAGAEISRMIARYTRKKFTASSEPETAPAATPETQAAGPDRAHRTFPTAAALARVSDYLARHENFVRARMLQTDELIRNSHLSPRRSSRAEELCYLVVPFWSAKRDEIIARMSSRGVPTYFTYCPPMNRVFANRVRCDYVNQEQIAEWCRHILPVDVKHRRDFVEEISR